MDGGKLLALLHQGWHERTFPSSREKRTLLGDGENAIFTWENERGWRELQAINTIDPTQSRIRGWEKS